MKGLFFYKLYFFNRRMFVAVVLFSGLTIFFNVMGDEVAPFFVWGMYSARERSDNNYDIYQIQINDSLLVDYTSHYTDNNRFFLLSPLAYYHSIKQNHFKDPTLTFLENKLGAHYSALRPMAEKITNGKISQENFSNWYVRYLEQTTGIAIYKLKVNVIRAHFNPNLQLQTDPGYSLLVWEHPE